MLEILNLIGMEGGGGRVGGPNFPFYTTHKFVEDFFLN